MTPSIPRTTLLLRHLRPPSPFTASTTTRNCVRNMSHSLYIDETPAEVKNAKASYPSYVTYFNFGTCKLTSASGAPSHHSEHPKWTEGANYARGIGRCLWDLVDYD